MSKILSHAAHIFGNMKLRSKLLLSYLFLIIIPLDIYYFTSSRNVYRYNNDRVVFISSQNFEQAFSALAYRLYKINSMLTIIETDPMIYNIYKQEKSDSSLPDQLDLMHKLLIFLQSFEDRVDVANARLYVDQKLIYSEEQNNIFNYQTAMKTTWYQHLASSGVNRLWCPSSYFESEHNLYGPCLSVIKSIKNPDNYRESIGLVRIDFYKADIEAILNNAVSVPGGVSYLINMNNEIIASSDYILSNNDIPLVFLLSSEANGNDYATFTSEHKSFMVRSRLINNTDWYMVAVIPKSEIAIESNVLQKDSFILLVAILAAANALAYIISKSMTKRISNLNDKMRNIQNGELSVILNDNSSDEIGELTNNYNYMVNKVDQLLKEQYISGQNLKSAEIKMLQSQINPHFLYNTLDLIKWIAKKGLYSDVEIIVSSLANFYKLSLHRGDEVVTIEDELKHISFYFKIQETRYLNKLRLNIDVDETLYKMKILKITLQPLVENSIIHGILCKDNDSGIITISGNITEGVVHLYVHDDGVGIPPEVLSEINGNIYKPKSDGGFGINNINERLKLYYGNQYGLIYRSECEKGTTVDIQFPVKS